MGSETLVNFYQTTRSYNLEDSHLHTRRCENLKSYLKLCLNCQVNLIFHTILTMGIHIAQSSATTSHLSVRGYRRHQVVSPDVAVELLELFLFGRAWDRFSNSRTVVLVSIRPSRLHLVSYLKTDNDCFLTHHFQFTIHPFAAV
jgi:hypothetical protein